MASLPWLGMFRDVSASRHLWVLPLVAGTTWFATLTVLLARWLWLGRPRYPGQANPEVPFVSDIAAFTLQPVFVAGCAVTGAAFAGTVFAAHHARYAPRLYHDDEEGPGSEWRQATGLVALAAGLVAAAELVGLAVLDTFGHPQPHRYLLMGALGGLGLAAVLTAAVWWDQTWGPPRWAGLRKWCVLPPPSPSCPSPYQCYPPLGAWMDGYAWKPYAWRLSRLG